jgi:hypothetical protein
VTAERNRIIGIVAENIIGNVRWHGKNGMRVLKTAQPNKEMTRGER